MALSSALCTLLPKHLHALKNTPPRTVYHGLLQAFQSTHYIKCTPPIQSTPCPTPPRRCIRSLFHTAEKSEDECSRSRKSAPMQPCKMHIHILVAGTTGSGNPASTASVPAGRPDTYGAPPSRVYVLPQGRVSTCLKHITRPHLDTQTRADNPGQHRHGWTSSAAHDPLTLGGGKVIA